MFSSFTLILFSSCDISAIYITNDTTTATTTMPRIRGVGMTAATSRPWPARQEWWTDDEVDPAIAATAVPEGIDEWPEEEKATPAPLATSTPWDTERDEGEDKRFVPAARDPIELASPAASLAALSPLGGAGSWKGGQREEEEMEEPLANLTTPPVLSPPVLETPVSTRGTLGRAKGLGRGHPRARSVFWVGRVTRASVAAAAK